MSKVRGASRVGHVKNKLAAFVAILIGFISIGLSPAYALDERLIDVVEVTWNGAPELRGNAQIMADVIDTEQYIIEDIGSELSEESYDYDDDNVAK